MSIIHHDSAIGGFGALFARLRALAAKGLEKAEKSHIRRVGFAVVSPEVLGDIRLSAEEATGLRTYQEDLPFFMQTGFDRR